MEATEVADELCRGAARGGAGVAAAGGLAEEGCHGPRPGGRLRGLTEEGGCALAREGGSGAWRGGAAAGTCREGGCGDLPRKAAAGASPRMAATGSPRKTAAGASPGMPGGATTRRGQVWRDHLTKIGLAPSTDAASSDVRDAQRIGARACSRYVPYLRRHAAIDVSEAYPGDSLRMNEACPTCEVTSMHGEEHRCSRSCLSLSSWNGLSRWLTECSVNTDLPRIGQVRPSTRTRWSTMFP